MKLYLITTKDGFNGVLDLFNSFEDARKNFESYHGDGCCGETNILEVKYDGRIYDYELYDGKINFFEKIENKEGYAIPFLDRECLSNRGFNCNKIYHQDAVCFYE